MFRRLTLLFVFCFVFLGFSQTKTYQFAHLSTAEGLSQSSAIAIHQDNLGQIWIGTRDGLNKYDGNKFTVYRTEVDNPASISNNDILAIQQDKDGFIWVGTYNGLNKYNPKTNIFKRYFHNQEKTSLSNNTVLTIKQLSNGTIWIGTSNGLSVYDKSTDSFKNFLKNDYVLSILETQNASIFIGTTTGVRTLRDRENDNFQFKTSIGSEALHVQDLVENPKGDLLLATKDMSVLEYNPKTEKISPYFSAEALNGNNKNVRQLLFDDNNQLWLGTYNGLQIANKSRDITLLTNNIADSKSLSKNSIKSLFKDEKGSVWIGTYYGGVNIWDQSNVNFVSITQNPDKTGLSYNVVSSIENYKDAIFFGTEGGGITVLDKRDNAYQYINKGNTPQLSDNNIKSLMLSKNDKLWIGTFNSGITVYNPKSLSFDTSMLSENLKDYLNNVGVYAIKQDQEQNMWLGTFGKGLVKYNVNTKAVQIFGFNEDGYNSLSSNLVRALEIDAEQNVWVGAEKGLNKIDINGKVTNYFYDFALQYGDDVLTVFEDSNKQIWVGTKAKGLFVFQDSDFKSIKLSVDNKMISAVRSILEDASKNLWISTNQGLVKFNIKTKNTTFFNQKEGLISNEFNDNASLKTGTAEFYFGSPAGVTYFDSEKLTTNRYAPQVIITDFKIKNKSVVLSDEDAVLEKTIPFTESLKLSYDQGNFSVSFAMPNFINSNNNHYQYRLKGLEKEWVLTTGSTASYTIQNPGDYIFEVKGANSDNVWNTNATQLKIQLNPAPWRSWWAFLLYGLVILTALYFLMTILKSKTKLRHELELEHIETERTKEVNKAKLEFFTNISHEFRTPLALILGPLHQILEGYKGSSGMYKKLLVVESSANHLLKLINRLMDFRKLENNLFKLEAAEGNIVKFLKEIYLSFSEFAKDGDYDYGFHTTDEEILVYYDRYKLERVFYNLISNAFRYTPKNGKIAIRVTQENGKIIIRVEDSGVGVAEEYQDKIFERFFEVAVNNKPDNNYNKGTGIGLSIAKNIVNLHKGEISVSKNDNAQGSVFSVILPLGHEHLTEDEIIKDFKFSDDVSQYVTQLEEPFVILEDDIAAEIPAEEKLTILLVEDNKPLRKFMRGLLKDDYNILEAENGKVAFKIAKKEAPDLIVSDVVMPVMAGTELCSVLKQDLQTSHIPIVLLTSRSSLVYKLEGLESGADDYISKPFNVKEFKFRIKNLLDASFRLKEKFSSNDPLQPNEVIISSYDEKLYKNALQIVEDNIGNEEFDIPYFCSELGVSRTMLFTKTKAWSNFTPNGFIQHFRMRRAAQLLEQGKINISEVSNKVGFKNPKYFSKCFQKKFGETPTQYANKFFDY
ncbi:two-component regulator propeller domain-containing protein [Algibacter agarivorans]|uniref:histidine kinase n=1 Tax=Algibacter agarivorans TaxID=1109741 RepID=A0ABP9GUI4_9FLAO